MDNKAGPGVYQAIHAVMQDLGSTGISKSGKNETQGWTFRGIDAVYENLNPLLAQFDLIILPRVIDRVLREVTNKHGTILFYTTVTVEYDLVCARDGSKHTISVFGEAMDSGDKSVNKAMSAAYKLMAFQVFCIPVEGSEDPDKEAHEGIKSTSENKAPAPSKAFSPTDHDWEDLKVIGKEKGWSEESMRAIIKGMQERGMKASDVWAKAKPMFSSKCNKE